jgi:flagellar assembly protein FliH
MSDPRAELHKQTAYERWEMAPLADNRTVRAGPAAASQADLRLAQESERARLTGHRQGHQEGFTQGQAEGHADGLAQGLAEGRTMIDTYQGELFALLASFKEQITHARDNIGQQVLAVALDMAHAMLKSALEVEPQRILPLVEQTLQSLPALKSSALLYLHPQDLALLVTAQGEALAADGWHLRADPHMLRGGCRVETSTNEIDATLPTRWARLQQSLGQQGEWLSPPET